MKLGKENLLDSPGKFHALPSVHGLAVHYLQQRPNLTNPTSHGASSLLSTSLKSQYFF